jgi:hypothetical protein
MGPGSYRGKVSVPGCWGGDTPFAGGCGLGLLDTTHRGGVAHLPIFSDKTPFTIRETH